MKIDNNEKTCRSLEGICRKGLLVSVSGPSGVGKGTVIEKVRARYQDIAHSVSVTTRQCRPGEEEGVAYFFRTVEEFKDMMSKGEIVEHDIYLNNYYGTPLPPLLDLINGGQDVLFDLTVSGSLTLMEKCDAVVTIFLLPPSLSELERRLRQRGTESEEVIQRRLLEASVEIPKADLFEYLIINDDLDKAANKIISIIEAEKSRYFRQAGTEDIILQS